MKILSAAGEIYDGVMQKRTIGVVEEYVLDIFSVESDTLHNYDYVLHSLGELQVSGQTKTKLPYNTLNEEYGFKAIDNNSHVRDNNMWFTNVESRIVGGNIVLSFEYTEGIGIRTYFLYEPQSILISAFTPSYVSVDGWDNVPRSGANDMRPLILMRRKAKSTVFIAVHKPYMSGDTRELHIKKTREKIVIRSKNFKDIYDMDNQTYTRKIIGNEISGVQ